MHRAKAECGVKLTRLANTALRIHERDSNIVVDERGNVVEADGPTAERAQPVEEGEHGKTQPRRTRPLPRRFLSTESVFTPQGLERGSRCLGKASGSETLTIAEGDFDKVVILGFVSHRRAPLSARTASSAGSGGLRFRLTH